MAKIGRRSILTGQWAEAELPDELQEEIKEWLEARGNNEPHLFAQVAFPSLTAEQREFLISGITPEEQSELGF